MPEYAAIKAGGALRRAALAGVLSVAGHAAVLLWVVNASSPARPDPDPVTRITLVLQEAMPPRAHPAPQLAPPRAPALNATPIPPDATRAAPVVTHAPQPSVTPPAELAAPAAPTLEAWQLAARYTRKNSKRYRHSWAQLVRSRMGTAVAGPEQGLVRLRVTVAPGGRIGAVEEVWSTSATVSRRAQEAIRSLPPTPPTPTGASLVFETTISFLPYETGWPPSYQRDCEPDAPVFRNSYAWQGGASPPPAVPAPAGGTASEPECVAEAESLDEAASDLTRQIEQNRWGR